ncbi:hypothetical protein AAHB33_03045 [Paenarthrobacter sp. S56]|uniref:hypothetical protein n=1 Tax=Paenarthrobacter sp. S56 TaxID=3138179 RepID=UPI00321B73DA
MLRARPIHHTSRPEPWTDLLEALGLVVTHGDNDRVEFDAGSGRLALHRTAHASGAGSPQDGVTVFGVEVGVLDEFARRTREDGTIAEVTEGAQGETVQVTARDGFTFLADPAQRAADGTWATSTEADPALAVVATWVSPDVAGSAQELRNIGARPRSSADGEASFSTKNGGILRVVHGAEPESGELAFEYDGGLEPLLDRLHQAGIDARIEEDVLYVANPDAVGGSAPASIVVERARAATNELRPGIR